MSEFIELQKNPPVKERIILKADTRLEKGLRNKVEELKNKVWKKNSELENLLFDYEKLKKKMKINEDEKKIKVALLVKLERLGDNSEFEFNFEWLSYGDFNKLNRNADEFCKYKNIYSPACVIKILDEVTSEKSLYQFFPKAF